MTTKLLNSVLTRTIYYNSENRITSISDGGSFVYDSTGERIKKTENGVTSYYFFSTYEEEYEGTDKTVIKYYFANGQRIAKVSKLNAEASVISYFHTDHLGSSVMMTDEAGTRTMSSTYTPYGSDAYYAGVADTKYMFTGQEKDPGSGLYYYGARYYDPELGRFIQPDTILDGLNRYAYCHNNPVKYIDPTGQTHGETYWNAYGDYYSDNDNKDSDHPGTTDNDYSDEADRDWGRDHSNENNTTGGTGVPPITIDYYVAGNETPITVSYGNETYTVGEDLDYTDPIPLDAIFNVPVGAVLEMNIGDSKYVIAGTGRLDLSKAIESYNVVIASEEYKAAMRREKAIGYIEIGFGGIMMGGGIAGSMTAITPASAIGAVGLYTSGVSLAAYGLGRIYGLNKNEIY